ncbi:hypothetical protein NLU13_5682 [Sarocladium strictum]|uniref:DNA endonuclease activator Ctp1 C-terminal domain-containing protein n=1 Tax=Sarocladium strictum TaxID=5046 RepID=A0AA39GJ08_SARSR|nr:hypothetical protein NLU13_5682 [Sarocladium strictum]
MLGGMTENIGQDHDAFMKAISTAAEQYRQSLAAQYDAQVKDLREQYLERERDQNSVIERLKAENDELQSLLQRAACRNSKPTSPGALRVSDQRTAASSTPKAVSPPPVLKDSASNKDLQTAYSKLLAKFQLVENNFKKARELLERRKTEREQWVKRTAMLQEELDKLQHSGKDDSMAMRSPLGDVASSAILHAMHTSSEVSAPQKPASPARAIRQTPCSTQSDADEGPEVALPILSGSADQQVLAVKQEPSSDSPVVVSERAVRKRKRDLDQDEPAPARVKTETTQDSNPPPRLDRFTFNSEDNLDLGEVAQRISTPRKPRDARVEDADGRTPTAAPQIPPALRQARPGLYARATPGSARPSPLTPIDGNRRSKKVTALTSGTKRTQKDIEYGLGLLAEDGISYGLKEKPSHNFAGTPVSRSRLDDLLNNPTVGEPSPNISRSVARKLAQSATPRDDLLMPKPRELPFDKSVRASGEYAFVDKSEPSPSVTRRNRSPKRRENPSLQKRSGVLRTQPLSELKLDDFKINPKANEGVNYAFSDVVRDKSERAALPGCTDPHCCGEEFRALAISQRPNPPLTSDQRREEQRLLEEYLGDHAYRLAAMTKQERADVWIDAKTHELANKYGKHRHRYSRMRSPPGFWNADFPNTQEIEKEKQEASIRERKIIEERRREAMRPGGRWVFRDE